MADAYILGIESSCDETGAAVVRSGAAVSYTHLTEGLLPQPLLYLSAYFERNRREYYRLLLEVSQSGQ